MPYILFLIICAIWGSSFILMDRAVHVFSPQAVGFWRVAAGAAILGMFATIRRESLAVPRWAWPHLFFAGGIAYAWSYVLQPLLIQSGFGHGMMGMMVVFVPIATIVASVPMLGVRPTTRQLAGVVGGLACFGLIVFDTHDRGLAFGLVALAITVPVSYAFGNTYVRRYLHRLPALALTFWTLVSAAASLLIASLASDPAGLAGAASNAHATTWPEAAAAVATLGVLSTGVAMLLFNHLLIRHGPLFAGMVTYIVPMGAVLLGGIDREPVSPLQIAALATALAMVALVQFRAATTTRSATPVIQPAGTIDNDG